MLKIFRELIHSTDNKDEDAALSILEALSRHHKEIELDRTYWVSEWSWTPLTDGIFSYKQQISYSRISGSVIAFYSKENNRTYFPWDIYESKEECDEVCELKNDFGYAWDNALETFIDRHGLRAKR
ncbi:hypothetical protein [Cohnella hashimotonis]|uniref:Uncharacterized protein n=1 Tax=Cohnella hashimotonis TaxID=2826895 RepID=A0ABT6TAS6_9BACL|nr:hypothetical protein [Cohnella hashimotonis]MDI4643666.1 hypothetical protein [Cohnella hashimotonis]